MPFERPQRDFEALFNPSELRTSLISVALFVLAWESFRARVIEHVHMLYWNGIDESGHKYDENEYRRAILTRHKSPFRASLDWYKEVGAINDEDMSAIARLSSSRNRLVHELMTLVGTQELAPELANFAELARVYRKIEVWEIVNMELDSNPDWEGKEIIEEEIIPGPMFMMQLLTDVALGDEQEAWKNYEEFVKMRKQEPGSAQGAT